MYMDIVYIILPVLVGAVIGYCTNYIAIKMLFRPRTAVRIGSWKLPFTPGVIPANQGRIARACGAAVGEKLVTGDDMSEALKSDELKNHILDKMTEKIVGTDHTLEYYLDRASGMIADGGDEAGSRKILDKINDGIADKIAESAGKLDYRQIIMETAGAAIIEKTQGTMAAMFINADTVASLADPVAEKMENYIRENGAEIAKPVIKEETDRLAGMHPALIIEDMLADEDSKGFIKRSIEVIYDKLSEDIFAGAVKHIDIASLVEKKINEMDVRELEDLVMSVMKNELQAVINLGALIGAVIGIVNIFI